MRGMTIEVVARKVSNDKGRSSVRVRGGGQQKTVPWNHESIDNFGDAVEEFAKTVAGFAVPDVVEVTHVDGENDRAGRPIHRFRVSERGDGEGPASLRALLEL